MTTFLYVLGWLSLASSCLESMLSVFAGEPNPRRMRCAAWCVAAALFFIAARMPVS